MMQEDWLVEAPGAFNEAFVWLSSGFASTYYKWDISLFLSVAFVLYLSSLTTTILAGHKQRRKPQIVVVVTSDGKLQAFDQLERCPTLDGKLKKRFMSGELGDARQLAASNPCTSVSLPLLSVCADDLYQVPFDLNNYRRRIDAGVEEQRRQREILERLQDKVLKCRLKSAESRTADWGSSKQSVVDYPVVPFYQQATTSKSTCFDRNISSSSPGLHHVESNVWFPRATSTPNRNLDHYHSSLQNEAQESDIHSFGKRLRSEQLRNLFLEEMVDSLRHQVDATLGSNEVLSADIVRLSECLQREIFGRREDAQLAADRTIKQKRFADAFHQRLHELWIEFCALKRKVNDARNDIGFDLDTQKSEFLRLRRTLEILVRQTKDQQLGQENTSKAHQEAMKDILRKYEELVRRNAETELEKDNILRESSKLHGNLNRTNEEKEGLENVLQRIHRLPEVKSMLGKRTRSATPDARECTSTSLRYAYVLADVRTAFKYQTLEAESFKQKHEQAQYTQTQLESQIVQLETELRQAQSLQTTECNAHQEMKLEAERLKKQHVKLKDKIERFEAEKISMQSSLESSNQRLIELHSEQKSLIIQHQAEKHELIEQLQRESIQQPSCKRCPYLEAENDRLRSQQQGLRDEQNNLRKELQEEKHRCVEAERKVVEHKHEEQLTQDKLRSLTQQTEEKEIYCADLEKELEDLRIPVKEMERKFQQYMVEKVLTGNENSKLSDQVNSLKTQSSLYSSQLQQSRQQAQRDAEKWQEKLESLEKLANAQSSAMNDMAIKIEIREEQKNALQKELENNEEEFSRNLKLISQLTTEKATIERKLAACVTEVEVVKNALRDEQLEREHTDRRMAEYEQTLRTSQEEKEMRKTSERHKSIQLRELTSELALVKDKLYETKGRLDTQLEINEQQSERTDKLLDIEIGRLAKEHKAELDRIQSTNVSSQAKLEEIHKELVAGSEQQKLVEESLKASVAKQQMTEKVLRAELDMLQHKYNEKFVEWSDIQERISSKEESLIVVQQQLQDTKKRLGDSLKREQGLEKKMQEAENRISKSAQMIQKLYSDLEELSEQSESVSLQAETELARIRSETTRLNEEKTIISQELDHQLQKYMKMDERLRLAEAAIQDKEAQLNLSQETIRNINEEKDTIVGQFQKIEANLQSQLRESHKKLENVQQRHYDGDRSLEAQIQELIEQKTRQQNELDSTVAQKKKLYLQVKHISKDLALSKDIIYKLEINEKHLHRRLEEQKEKTNRFEETLIELRTNYQTASEDLNELREKYGIKKLGVDKAVMAKPIEAKEPMDACTLHELEEKKMEIEMQRDRIKHLEQIHTLELSKSQTKLSELSLQVQGYEEIARKIVIFAKNFIPEPLEPGQSSFPCRGYEFGSFKDIFEKEKPSISTFTMSGLVDVHPGYSHKSEGKLTQERVLDNRNSVDVAFQVLKSKIVEMENELQHKTTAFQRLKTESDQNKQELQEANSKLQDLKKAMRSLQEEKNSVETRLTNANRILLTQAEYLTANETEKQNFKVKVMSAEMHTRDKEARIKVLQDQLKTAQGYLEEEKQQHEKRESQWKDERLTMENDLDDYRQRMEQLRIQRDNITSEKEIQQSRLNTLEHRYSSLQQKSSEFEKSISEYQEVVNRLQKEQSEWKSTTYRVEALRKTTVDYQQTKAALDVMTAKWKSVEQGREQIRRELIDVRSKLTSATIKINNLKGVVNDLNTEKKVSFERIEVFEKIQRDSSLANKEKSRQLEQLQNERVSLVAELEDLKRQLQRVETGKRECETQIGRMRREMESHKNHVEALEMDKRRVEGVIRQTMMERQALDKSLGTMEKENTELYRNCSILQNNLTQLEQENNNRTSEINNRIRVKMEAEINRLNQEKRQLEKLLNQREQNYEQKEKMLDSQVQHLQHQLDTEKKRKRQLPSPNLPGPSTPSIALEQHYASMRRTTYTKRSEDLMKLQRAPFRP